MLQGQLNEQGWAGNRRLVVAADVQEGDNGSSSRLDFAPYLVSLKFPIKQIANWFSFVNCSLFNFSLTIFFPFAL